MKNEFVIFVLLMLLAIMLLIAYSLVVMAHEADKRAERMYKKWKEKIDERNRRSDKTQ